MEDKSIVPVYISPDDEKALQSKLEQATTDLIKSDGADQALVDIFQMYMQKKRILREIKLDALEDASVQQLLERVLRRGDGLSTEDLIKIYSTIVNARSKTGGGTAQSADDLRGNSTTIITNPVNINVAGALSSEQRAQVREFLQKAGLGNVMQAEYSANTQIYQAEFEEKDDSSQTDSKNSTQNT